MGLISIANSNDRGSFLSLFSWPLDHRYQIHFYSTYMYVYSVNLAYDWWMYDQSCYTYHIKYHSSIDSTSVSLTILLYRCYRSIQAECSGSSLTSSRSCPALMTIPSSSGTSSIPRRQAPVRRWQRPNHLGHTLTSAASPPSLALHSQRASCDVRRVIVTIWCLRFEWYTLGKPSRAHILCGIVR